MKAIHMQIEKSDEFNLLSFLKIIIDEKWKIIATTMVSLIIGCIYNFYTPDSFKLTSTMDKYNQDVLVKFKTLNDIMIEEEQRKFNIMKNISSYKFEVYSINADMIFERFINEFNDYEEMVSVLKTSPYVIDKIKNFNDTKKNKFLLGLANNFKVKKAIKYYQNYRNLEQTYPEISFTWHNLDDGIFLFKSALDLTFSNVKNTLLRDINNLASSLNDYNQRQITKIKNKLNSIRKSYNLQTAKRTLYLTEHANIARELGIVDNIVDSKNTSSDILIRLQSTKTYDQNLPYYLRGYKAIDKEIEMINSRSTLEKDLMTPGYISLQEDLILLENDERSNDLKKAAKFLNNSNLFKQINYSLEFAKVTNNKKSNLIILFSILTGAMLGIFYVLISNGLKNIK